MRLVLGLVAIVAWSQTRGLVSSNDGSHVALARAFVRGEVELGRDAALTLWVDHARRDGRDHSDRPPGTAAAAVPALALAVPLDRTLGARTRARIAAGVPPHEAVIVRPASERFIATYGARRRMTAAPTIDLVDLQGTALVLGVHTVLLGVLGLGLVDALLRRRHVSEAGRAFALAGLGLATLWGPYATTLFAHETGGVLLATTVLACERAREARLHGGTAWPWELAAGVAGAWAIASDHALVLAVIPTVLLLTAPRGLGRVVLGAIPIALAVLAYDAAAFGSPWHVGYDFQSNFAFARTRARTFGGDPWQGLWTLVGFGHGAGVLAQAPVITIGAAALALGRERRWLLALLPWLAVLVFHRTPWGGATEDHRYLVPALPLLAVGLGLAWDRWARSSRIALIGMLALAAVSAGLVWTHFWQWRG